MAKKLPIPQFAPKRQSGISTILAVVSFSVFLASLGVVEVGNLMWEKGRAQRIADVAALAAARTIQQGISDDFVNALAQQNGLGESDTLTISCLEGPDYDSVPEGEATPEAVAVPLDECSQVNVAQARVQKTVSTLFPFSSVLLNDLTVDVTAQALISPTVTGVVSSGLLVADPDLLGLSELQATVLSNGNLLTVDANITLLQVATELGLSSTDELIGSGASPVGAGDLLDAVLAAGGTNTLGISADVSTDLTNLLTNAIDIPVSELIDAGDNAALASIAAIDLNAFVGAIASYALGEDNPLGIELSDGSIALDTDAASLLASFGVSNVGRIRLVLLEPPKFFIAEQQPYQPILAYQTVDQLALEVDLSVSGGQGITNALKNILKSATGIEFVSEFMVRLKIKSAEGAVEVSNLMCSLPQSENQIDVAVSSQTLRAELCPCEDDPDFENPTDLLRFEINPTGGLLSPLVSLLLATIDPLFSADDVVLTLTRNDFTNADPEFSMGDPETFVGVDYPHVATSNATALETLDLQNVAFSGAGATYSLGVKDNGGIAESIINNVVNGSVNGFLSSADAALSPALGLLGGALDVVFDELGITLVPVEARIVDVNCENAVLIK